MLQCVAVYCSTVKITVCFVFSIFEKSGVLQCVSVCCSVFQCVAVYGSTVPSTYRGDSRLFFVFETNFKKGCLQSALQCVEVRCSAL